MGNTRARDKTRSLRPSCALPRSVMPFLIGALRQIERLLHHSRFPSPLTFVHVTRFSYAVLSYSVTILVTRVTCSHSRLRRKDEDSGNESSNSQARSEK